LHPVRGHLAGQQLPLLDNIPVRAGLIGIPLEGVVGPDLLIVACSNTVLDVSKNSVGVKFTCPHALLDNRNLQVGMSFRIGGRTDIE
jgi:hypothetical protein